MASAAQDFEGTAAGAEGTVPPPYTQNQSETPPLISKSPVAQVCIGNVSVGCVLDTGADTSLIPSSFYHENLKGKVGSLTDVGNAFTVISACGQEIPVEGYLVAPLSIGNITIQAGFLVRPDLENGSDRQREYPVIIGCNILRQVAHTFKESDISPDGDWEMICKILTSKIQPTNYLESEHCSLSSEQFQVYTTGKIQNLPPRSISLICCEISGQHKANFDILVEPQQGNYSDNLITALEGCCHVDSSNSVQIPVCNFSIEPKILLPATRLATAIQVLLRDEIVSEITGTDLVCSVQQVGITHGLDTQCPESDEPTGISQPIPSSEENSADREVFKCTSGEEILLPLGVSLKDLDQAQAEKAAKLFDLHKAAFSNGDYDLGYCDIIPHKIRLKDDKPISLPYRRIPPHEVEEVKRELQKMLDRGVIRKSSSCYGSPIVIVRKKNGSIRLCIDYRRVNAKTVPDAFPLPRIEEALEALGNATLFSALDLAHGYFQVAMHPDSIPITAFRVPWGLFEMIRLPMGLCNSPATFERIVEHILGDLNYTSVLLFLDDILCFSNTFDQHIERLGTVLERLTKYGLKLNGKKCKFFQTQVLYLGHMVSSAGISVDPGKIQRIITWPIPKSADELRSALGLFSYYRR